MSTVVEFRCPAVGVASDELRGFEGAAVFKESCDTRRSEAVIGELTLDVGMPTAEDEDGDEERDPYDDAPTVMDESLAALQEEAV